MQLTKNERIWLIACLQLQNNQRQILKALGKPVEDIPESSDAIEALVMGAEHFYEDAAGCLNARLNDDKGISMKESSEILDVLDMYRAIEDYKAENPKDDEVNQHHAARFRGFDGNHESRWRWFAHFAVFNKGLYTELKPQGKESQDFNSHHPMAEQYRRMVGVWGKRYKLTKENILAILKAAE